MVEMFVEKSRRNQGAGGGPQVKEHRDSDRLVLFEGHLVS